MKKLLLTVLGLVVAAFGVMAWRASRLVPAARGSRTETPPPVPVTVDRLGQALRFATISTQDGATWNPAPFIAFRDWLSTAYPRVHNALTREVVNGYSLLYTWKGTDTTLAPMLLMGHFDVVPVELGTEGMWTHPPFAGDTAQGFVWGRGALDDKATVIGVLEGVDALLAKGFVPRRTVLLAFGHDEEIGGYQGAAQLARAIEQRYGRVSFLVDEGGVVSDSILPGLTRRAALIGVAEKASMTIELSVTAAGGHSSMPPNRTALGRLSRAVIALEDHQMPARLTPVTRALFGAVAAEMGFGARLAFANLAITEPVVLRALVADPKSASMVRTSTAVTMASGSPKENVLPIRATAIVNFRMLQGDSAESVVAHVTRAVNDTSVQVRVLGTPRQPSPTADMSSPEYALLTRTIARWYPDALVLPNLLAGATDTRHYEHLTRNVYRFAPYVVTPGLIGGAHGTNERIGIAEFLRGVGFWADLIERAQAPDV
jgi:carboxypeptidase PM20D1